jgi:hypothetical protein
MDLLLETDAIFLGHRGCKLRQCMGTELQKSNGKICRTTPTLRACHDNISLWQLVPHLTHKGIDGHEWTPGTQESWSPAYRALSLPQNHPGILSGAHGVLRRTCYGLEASTGFLGHGASTQQRCVGDKRACFVVASLQAKWRSSKNAKTSALWWSKQRALAFLLLLFRNFCYWSETTAESCVVEPIFQI